MCPKYTACIIIILYVTKSSYSPSPMDTVAVSLLIIRSLMGSSGLRTRLTVKVSRDSFSSSSLIVISTGTTVVLSLKTSTLVSESKSKPAEQEGTVKQLKNKLGS